MPSSRPEPIPHIINRLIHLKPSTILDVGFGFGKWGMLAREFTDVWWGRGCNPEHWTGRIDGIEIFEKYIQDLQREIYDNIYIGNALDLLPLFNIVYDVIIASDILEHMTQEDGVKFLDQIKERSKHAFIVTPISMSAQVAVYGNQNEIHLYQWSEEDLKKYGTVIRAGNAHTLEMNNEKNHPIR